jgi:Fe-S-cluster-containing dehydrogenase component
MADYVVAIDHDNCTGHRVREAACPWMKSKEFALVHTFICSHLAGSMATRSQHAGGTQRDSDAHASSRCSHTT